MLVALVDVPLVSAETVRAVLAPTGVPARPSFGLSAEGATVTL